MKSKAQPSSGVKHDVTELGLAESQASGRTDLLLAMTLIMLVRHVIKYDELLVVGAILLTLGLSNRNIRWNSMYWWALAGTFSYHLLSNWWHLDNHIYLMSYWIVAIAAVLQWGRKHLESNLAFNSVALIFACMFLATAQKGLSNSFTSSEFFNYALLTDDRFDGVTAYLGGVPEDALAENRRTVRKLRKQELAGKQLLTSSPRVELLSYAATGWTLAIEGVLALLFACALIRGSWPRLRGWALILFMVTTYPIANVVGFAWLLCILALAQTPPQQKTTRYTLVSLYVAFAFLESGSLLQL